MSTRRRPVLVVSEHPARTVGFATVAGNVAAGLSSRGWPVTFLGVYADDAPALPFQPPYRLVEVGDAAAAGRWIVEHVDAFDRPQLVLVFGRSGEVRTLERVVDADGRRLDVDLRYYLPADFAPLPQGLGADLGRLDGVIPATRMAADVVAGHTTVTQAIPHGVDASTFAPMAPDQRDDVRRDVFSLGPRDTLIGTFSRNSGNKRLDLAARVVATIAHGRFTVCVRCQRHLVAPIRPTDGRLGDPPDRCDRCGHADVARPSPSPITWQLHTEDADAEGRRASNGHDIDRLTTRYELAETLWWERDQPVGRGVSVGALARRMAACDVHLLLSDCGGWELTMLETAACGVPNVIADAGAFISYAREFSLVAPVVDRFGHGHRGEVDVGEAVAAVRRLLDDADLRRSQGLAGRAVGVAHDWPAVLDRWEAVLA